ncbi:hypothetical protein [Flavobacterium aciduliphilum]|uniref:Uncharacterized protein n=1 Tax=Flavobacterium aciduliphilum TaxID=1101402 RepID=A0A328YQU3_9FLAO|nr:hypothetical protein [Flavobacterium aciduliphilum]RAR72466.1 hypothetical protein CLV55_10531 [Flavobacterium aciduliphilum]
MAKNKSLFKIEGTLDDVTFYKSADGYLVRTKGGVSRERMMKDPAFERTRENMGEFGHCASMGKMLRSATDGLAKKAKDSKLSSRLQKAMSEVKKLDGHSARGQRKVSEGVCTDAGRNVLKGFDFNMNAPLKSVLDFPIELDVESGKTVLTHFKPKEDLNYPQGATHFSLQSAFLNLDFSTGIYNIKKSDVLNVPIDLNESTLIMDPNGAPEGSGTHFYFLFIAFYQEVNGELYLLKNGSYNVLNIIGVV